MRKVERVSAILDRVADHGRVDVEDLASSLGVSRATVRRDLQSLSASRLIVRTHGGALAVDPVDPVDPGDEVPVRIKASRRHAEKLRIGRAAADLVEEGAVVGMTGGTTALELARVLASRRGITVVTNAINIATELAGSPGLQLIVIGGIVRSSYELVGPAAEAMLANYHLDVAFIGVDGLTAREGCTTHDEMEAQADRAFLDRAARNVVIADSSKIGIVRFARISPLDRVSDVVTDDDIDPGQLRALRDAGARVITV